MQLEDARRLALEEASLPVWCGCVGRDAGLLAMDISFEAASHGGMASSRYALEAVSLWPETIPLMLVLKELLAQRGLNEPFTGGLSSYSLLLLVLTAVLQAGVPRLPTPLAPDLDSPRAHLLQRIRTSRGRADPTDEGDERDEDSWIGNCLLFFLDFFGRRFDPQAQAVSVARAEQGILCLKPHPHADECSWSAPLIEDPLDTTRNVARSCFGFAQIQHVFAHSLAMLQIKGSAAVQRDDTCNILSLMLSY